MSSERIGDMEPRSRVRLSKEEDGIITVQVIQFDRAGLKGFGIVQFSPEGSSPKTYEALAKLIEAIDQDSERGKYYAVAYDPPWPNPPE